jgi:tetraprenyl-beta-curcumene synthase
VSSLTPGSPASGAGARREAAGALAALARANLRFWPTVAPVVRRELARWEGDVAQIGDRALRELAHAKLTDEHFNAEVAATLATLAPRQRRAVATRAIVALELLFDYLDGRSERPSREPIAEGERLFAPFVAAVGADGGRPARPREGEAWDCNPADAGYVWALSDQVHEALASLPAAKQVWSVAHAAAVRCAEAQTRMHAAASLGEAQLERWARDAGGSSGLEWREFAGGCASSVLSMHALIAAAASPATSTADARAIDAAYLAIGGVITTLDSLVDEQADALRGEASFTRLFDSDEELARRVQELIREAHARARAAPDATHHVMTLAGAIAYYTTHPGGREGRANSLAPRLRSELSPTIWPTLAVMAGWRAAKRARALARRGRARRRGASAASET